MDKAEVPQRASLVLLVACSGQTPIVSDAELDEFARIGAALAPEKVSCHCLCAVASCVEQLVHSAPTAEESKLSYWRHWCMHTSAAASSLLAARRANSISALASHLPLLSVQELLETLTYVPECVNLTRPPCWRRIHAQ